MAGEIERLIEWLVDDISCHGDRGYPVSQALATIRDYHHGPLHNDTVQPAEPAMAYREIEPTDEALLSSMWDWIRERDDISIGEKRQWNHLTLTAILAMPEPELPSGTGQERGAVDLKPTVPSAESTSSHAVVSGEASSLRVGETPVTVHRPRIYASANRMWESIAGHSADFKRVPRLEWAALVGIATTKSDGILQGDLCRLIGQDKRSLPRRTDSLAQKGYITKRTTLVRGVKTSKMWLRRLAPNMPADPTQAGVGERASVKWSREALTVDMEPVAWCDRWTGKSIDTHMLAKTAIEIIKAWNIIRYDDLRRKLGIEGLKWQMKTQARLCRWMVRRGIVKYVAATLGERLFKDCLKFSRDFTPDDWDSYLATGKVKARAKPEVEGLAQYKETNLGTSNKNGSIAASRNRHGTAARSSPSRESIACQDPWRPEKPLSTTVMDVIRAGDAKGVPNKQIGKHTMGPPFTRYVSSISTTLATPALQPAHLTRFQVSSRLHRVEKSAIYLFSLPQLADNRHEGSATPAQPQTQGVRQEPAQIVEGTITSPQLDKGFSVPMQWDLLEVSLDLSTLAHVANERRQWKSIRAKSQVASNTHHNSDSQNDVEDIPALPTHHHASDLMPRPSPNGRLFDSSGESPITTTPRRRPGYDAKDSGPQKLNMPRDSFIVTLKVSPPALSQILESSGSSLGQTALDVISSRQTPDVTHDNRYVDEANESEDLESRSSVKLASTHPGDELNGSRSAALPAGKRWRPKAKNASSSRNLKKGIKAGVFMCDKCGGVWKNDNGLKYHLERSSSSCNTTYEPPPPKVSHFQARRAQPSVQEPLEEEASSLERSARSTRATKNRNYSAQLSHVIPAKPVYRSPRPVNTSALHARAHRRNQPSTESRPAQVGVLLGQTNLQEDSSDTLSPPLQRGLETDGFKYSGLIDVSNSSTRNVLDGERHVRSGADRSARLRPPATPRKADQRGDASLIRASSAGVSPSHHERSPKEPTSERQKRPGSAGFAIEEQDSLTESGNLRGSGLASNLHSPAGGSIGTSVTQKETEGPRNTAISTVGAGDETSTYPAFSMPAISSEQDTNGYAPDSRLHRASEIIMYLIQTNDGVFPGDRSAYLGFLSVWERAFPSDPPPSNNNVQVAINKLVSRNKIIKTTHAFRDAKGAFKSANVLLIRGRDPFCPAAVAVKEKIIAEHPRPYVLAAFTPSAEMFGQDQKMWKGEPIFSNRRKLENDVGVLDAPFYINESLKRRKPKYVETDESSPSKRPRADYAAFDTSHKMDDKRVSGGNTSHRARGAGQHAKEPLHQMAASKQTSSCPELTFLEPNTCLEEDDEPGFDLPTVRDAHQQVCLWSGEEGRLPRREFEFTAPRKISRHQKTWPPLDVAFFEQNHSFVMDGWMPNSLWFLKCGLPHTLDEMITTGKRKTHEQSVGSTVAFMKQVNGCRRWEASLEAQGLAALGSIAPDYVFINHRMDTQIEWRTQTLIWSPENQLAFRDSHVGANQPEPDAIADAHPPKRRKYIPRTQSRLEPTAQMDMKYRTLLPWSRAPGAETDTLEGQTLDGEDDAVVIAAFVATRTLLGGADKYIEWGLMMKLFPSRSLAFLRKFWSKTRRDRPASVKQLTERFQKRFIAAYERNEVPSLDFNDYVRYDWVSLIRWTASLVEDSVTLPSARADLEQHFTLEDAVADVHDWQEDYYNVQSSIYSRLEAVTSKSAVILLDEGRAIRAKDSDLVKAKTWIRSLCSTQQGLYTPQKTRTKMASLTENGETYNNDLLERAIDTLQGQNVIARTRRRRYENRSYRLSEWYLPRLAKQSHEQKFIDAVAFKALLDTKFRLNEKVRIPYVIRDGEVMAMINLQAHGRVTISPVDMPQIPLGFKPGVYESRKFPKTFYNFGLQITPTSTYMYDDEIRVLKESRRNAPASQSPEGALPLWSDFFGALKVNRWRQVLGAVAFAIAMRGPLDLGGVVSTLKPNLEDFEVQLVIEWGLRNEVLERATPHGTSFTTAEWWWLVVGSQGAVEETEVAV